MFYHNETNFNIAFGLRAIGSNTNIPREDYDDYLKFVPTLLVSETELLLDYHDCTTKDRELFYDEVRDGEIDRIE